MSKTNKKHLVSTFQDEWFSDEKYLKWTGKDQHQLKLVVYYVKRTLTLLE